MCTGCLLGLLHLNVHLHVWLYLRVPTQGWREQCLTWIQPFCDSCCEREGASEDPTGCGAQARNPRMTHCLLEGSQVSPGPIKENVRVRKEGDVPWKHPDGRAIRSPKESLQRTERQEPPGQKQVLWGPLTQGWVGSERAAQCGSCQDLRRS